MASTAEAVKEILVTRSADFAGRQSTYSLKERTLGMLFLCTVSWNGIQGSFWIPGNWINWIDLIHDTRHLCVRIWIDGILAMSHGFSTINHGRICLFYQHKTTI